MRRIQTRKPRSSRRPNDLADKSGTSIEGDVRIGLGSGHPDWPSASLLWAKTENQQDDARSWHLSAATAGCTFSLCDDCGASNPIYCPGQSATKRSAGETDNKHH